MARGKPRTRNTQTAPRRTVCTRDAALRALAAPPSSLSFRGIAGLRLTDVTEDGGKTWRSRLYNNNPLTRETVELLRRYLFRHSQKGEPFRDWRPDIGRYIFQAAGHRAQRHMSAMTVRRCVRRAHGTTESHVPTDANANSPSRSPHSTTTSDGNGSSSPNAGAPVEQKTEEDPSESVPSSRSSDVSCRPPSNGSLRTESP